MATPKGQPKPGTRTQSAPNRFPRRGGGDGTEAGQKRPGYPDVTTSKEGVRGGRLIEGQDLRGYVPVGDGAFPAEDGNRRPGSGERTVREIPAP